MNSCIFHNVSKIENAGTDFDLVNQKSGDCNIEKTLDEMENALDELRKSIDSKKKSLMRSSKYSEISNQHPFLSMIFVKNCVFGLSL
jgi:hypothetical protein